MDHDRLFKELLTTFFVEFVDLFFNRIAPAQLFYLRGYDIAKNKPLRVYE